MKSINNDNYTGKYKTVYKYFYCTCLILLKTHTQITKFRVGVSITKKGCNLCVNDLTYMRQWMETHGSIFYVLLIVIWYKAKLL